MSWLHDFRWIFAKLSFQSNIVSLNTSRDFNNSVTWLGGGNSRRRLPSSRISGMVFTYRDSIAGDEKFLKQAARPANSDPTNFDWMRMAKTVSLG